MWTLREAQRLKQGGTWPNALPPNARLALTFDAGLDDLAQGLTASENGSGSTRSADQKKGGTHSFFVGSTSGNATFSAATNRGLLYGSGSTWNIMHSDFTVECWIFTTNNSHYRGIVGRDDGGSSRHWNLYMNSVTEGSAMGFTVFNTGNASFIDLNDTVAMTLNQWVHVAVVRDGSVFRLYKNGTQVSSANVSSGSGTISTASGALTVGALFESGIYALPGYIDELLITTNCRYPNGTTFTPSASI
jgi:membrane peptidoglycan carboxypeptidase